MTDKTRQSNVSRRGVLAVAALVGTGGLAGCSGDSGDGSDGTSGATQTPGDSGTGDGQDGGGQSNVDLEAWAWDNHSAVLSTLAEQYEGASVNAVDQASDSVGEQLVTAIQSQSNLPSISLIRGQLLKTVARNGGLLRMDDLIEPLEEDMYNAAITLNKVDGQWNSIPNDLGPFVLYYNVNEFEKAGLPTDPEDAEQEIQTWDQFIEAGETYENETGNKFMALNAIEAAHGLGMAMFNQNGGEWYNDDGEFEFDQQANVEALSKLSDIYESVAANADWLSGPYWDLYRNNELAVAPGAQWFGAFMEQNLPEQSGDWRVMRLPRLGDSPRAANWGGVGAGIPLALPSEQQDAAREFGEFWHLSPEAVNVKLENNVFPAFDVSGTEQYDAEYEYFGGQQIVHTFHDVMLECPDTYQRPSDRAQELARDSFTEVLQNGADPEETLQERHEQILNTIEEQDRSVSGTTGE